MCNDEEFLEKIAFVLASEHRKNIILFMDYDLYSPKQIGDAIDVRTNHISNLLAQLRKYNLVYNTTPRIRKGRLYSLTDDGKKVLEYIKQKE